MERQVGPVGGILKRAFDCALALMVLMLMSPIMIMTALLIVITMGRPIFSRQQSLGVNGMVFTRLKFRTTGLVDNKPGDRGVDLSEGGAPRSPFAGRMLSERGLDGLPQLLNVACGHMSFVGPPCVPPNATPDCFG